MAKKAKASKAVIASLLATSAIVPAIAVSADVDGSLTVNGTEATTRNVEAVTTSLEVTPISAEAVQVIDFTIDADTASAMLARFISGPGTLIEMDGQYYIELDLEDSVLEMMTEVTVDGESVIFETEEGTKTVLIPVNEDFEEVEVTAKIVSPYATGEYTVTLIPDGDSIRDLEEATEGDEEEVEEEVEEVEEEEVEEEEEEEEEEEVAYGQIEDGEYDVTFDAYHPTEETDGYTAITRQLDTEATLVVEDGEYFLDVNATEDATAIILEYQVLVDDEYVVAETVAGSTEEYPHVVRLPLADLNELTTAKLHVSAGTHDEWYDFKIAVNQGLDLPEVEEDTELEDAETLPVFVYADGKKDLSIMQGKYLADEVTVTATETGYDVDVTFPEGQYLNDFEVEGATVALADEEEDGDNTVKVYTVSVDDLTKIYKATVDLSVSVGDFSYDEVYGVQLQFGGKQNPFGDIQTAGNYGAIVQLYSQGIFKEAEKFNPNNTVKRSQFALMLNRALNLEAPATSAFTDIATYDAEAQNAIKALNGYGVINGTSATTFAPANDITRKNAALMIYRLLVKEGYTPTGAAATFADVPSTDKEAATAIAELNALGIMTGSEGNFKPQNKLTRNQMAKVLNNTLSVIEGL